MDVAGEDFFSLSSLSNISAKLRRYSWPTRRCDSIEDSNCFYKHIFSKYKEFSSRHNRMPARPVYRFRPYEIERVECTGTERTAGKKPLPRSGHRIVSDDGYIYSFGGYNPLIPAETGTELAEDSDWQMTKPLFKELWCLNLATRRWSKVTMTGNVPEFLASHSAVLDRGHLLVFGGTGVPFGLNSSNVITVCKLSSREVDWAVLKEDESKCIKLDEGDVDYMTQPHPQYGQAILLHDNNLYVVGGTTGFEYSIDVHRFNITERVWEVLYRNEQNLDSSYAPTPRYRHEIVWHEGRLLVFGGGTALTSYEFDVIPAFNVELKVWEKITTLPTPGNKHRKSHGFPPSRRCHGCMHQGDFVYLCGGYNGRKIFSDIWQLKLSTLQWSCYATTLPEPVYFQGTSITSSGCMYSFGGVTSIRQNSRTDAVYKMWLTIPKLSELSWEACLHYYQPGINSAPSTCLLKAGVPAKFVDRLKPQKM